MPPRAYLEMERETGLEPATSTLARWRSTTEPLPRTHIYYIAFVHRMVGERRVELLRLSAPDPKSGVSAIPPLAPGQTGGSYRTRTCGPLIKSQLLYQLS